MKFKSLLALGTVLAAMGLASCANDDFADKSSTPKGNPIEVTVQAAINNGNASRAEFNETATGAIKSKWNDGDCIFAYNPKDGSYAGYLVASIPEGETAANHAEFSGTLYLYENCTLYFYYLGTDPNRDYNEFWIDLTEQNYSLEDLGELAVMVDPNVRFTYNSDNRTATLKSESSDNGSLLFNLILSYAHFDISLPEGVEYKGEDIILQGDNLRNGAALLLVDNELDIPEQEEKETITINSLGDLYFAFIPGDDIELHFSTEIDGIRYYYDYPRKMKFETGVYYRRDAGDGTFVGVPITLRPDNKYTLNFNDGFDTTTSSFVSGATLPKALEHVTQETSYTFTIPTEAPELEGYNFLGYRKDGSTDTTVVYAPGDEVTIDAADDATYTAKDVNDYTLTLEPLWELAQPEYTFVLSFTSGWIPGDEGRTYMSGISNTIARQTVKIRANSYTFDIPNTTPTADGYIFLGLNNYQSMDATPVYQPGGQITVDVNDELTSYFTVSADGKTYTRKLQYVWEKADPRDGTIFGLRWTQYNVRSWVDAKLSSSTIRPVSYIPGIPLAEQNISLPNETSRTIFDSSENNYQYHFQWSRNFGFISTEGSNANYLEYNVPLPNNSNFNSTVRQNYYNYGYYSSGQITRDKSYSNFDVYVYPSAEDWCSTRRTTWQWDPHPSNSSIVIRVAPEGFHIPTIDELSTLLPEGENGTYSYGQYGSINISSATLYPFFVKQLGDGTTVVWSVSLTSAGRWHLDLRRVLGNITLQTLNKVADWEDENNGEFALPAAGSRAAGAVQYGNQRGFYWSNECGTYTSNKAFALQFYINTSAKTIMLQVGYMSRKFAMSVRCIYDN